MERVLASFSEGLAVKATANLSPALQFYYEPDVKQYEYDPDLAAQMLDDAADTAIRDMTKADIDVITAHGGHGKTQLAVQTRYILDTFADVHPVSAWGDALGHAMLIGRGAGKSICLLIRGPELSETGRARLARHVLRDPADDRHARVSHVGRPDRARARRLVRRRDEPLLGVEHAR